MNSMTGRIQDAATQLEELFETASPCTCTDDDGAALADDSGELVGYLRFMRERWAALRWLDEHPRLALAALPMLADKWPNMADALRDMLLANEPLFADAGSRERHAA